MRRGVFKTGKLDASGEGGQQVGARQKEGVVVTWTLNICDAQCMEAQRLYSYPGLL